MYRYFSCFLHFLNKFLSLGDSACTSSLLVTWCISSQEAVFNEASFSCLWIDSTSRRNATKLEKEEGPISVSISVDLYVMRHSDRLPHGTKVRRDRTPKQS